ncbi:MAG: class IV adenylate cyclase, partial [Gemmataceae bacterium]
QEADHYFNAPDRDFAKTDEALRIRSIGANNFLTYKGAKRDQTTKTRKEIEVSLGSGADAANQFAELLKCLGYKPVAIVRKERRKFRWQHNGFDVEATLDEVDKVGSFVELEIVGAEEVYERARDTLFELAREFGLGESERRSYLEMYLHGA